MLVETGPRASMYLVLDEILSSAIVPPGAHGAMFAAIDELKSSAAPDEERIIAERISVEMHKLEWAIRRADSDASAAARDQLRCLAANLINFRIQGSDSATN